MERLFLRIYDFLHSHRAVMRASLAAVCVLCAAAALRLSFGEDIAGFLPDDAENERINWAYRHVGATNKVVINISMRDTAAPPDTYMLACAAEFLAERMEASQYVKSVTCRIDRSRIMEVSRFVTDNMPLYMTDADYMRIDSLLTTPDAVEAQIEGIKAVLSSPAGSIVKQTVAADPVMISGRMLSELSSFGASDAFRLIDDCIFTADCREAVVLIDAAHPVSDTAAGAALTRQIDEATAACREAFEVEVSTFGGVYIAASNARQIKRDSIASIAIALVLIAALLVYFFRDARTIALVGVTIAFGALFAFGFTGLLTQRMSLIAIGAGSIIFGIAVNYPLHLLSHVREGYTVRQSIKDIVQPLTTGNITTVGAFLSLLAISSSAMHDLGLFASLLLAGTILFVLIFLPHLVGNSSRNAHTGNFGRIADSAPERSRAVTVGIAVLTIVLSFFGSRVRFETDMAAINYMTPQQRADMHKMLAQTQGTQHLIYFVSEGATMDEALTAYEAVLPALDSAIARGTGSLTGRAGIGCYLPSRAAQQRSIERWNEFWLSRRDAFIGRIDSAARAAGFRAGAFDGFYERLRRDYEVHDMDYFAPVAQTLAQQYLIDTPERAMVFTLLHADPAQAVATEQALNSLSPHSFAFDSGSITRRMVAALSADFDYVLYICGFIVLLFLTLSFGRLELSLISFLPLAVSWIWILGLMGIFGMGFNIVNIILATFIFGMGDDYTIFITEGAMYEYAYGRKMLSTYKNTVALSALIMFVGIGALIIARHPAMRSLAEVTIVGMFSVVVTAYVLPPFFFRLLTYKGGKKRTYPLTIKNMAATAFSFAAFLAGAAALALYGFFTLTIGGRNERNRLRYHRLLWRISRFVLHRVPFTRTTLANASGETFERNAVIVVNHQSHLDLMALLSLTPKIIVITNRWVWRFPLYGDVIRYADFRPVEMLADNDFEPLREMISQGYSVAVFPEGTRSESGRMARFHRGAFEIARRFGLDIVPVVLHGFNHVLPKSDLLLRSGMLNVEIMPRITPDANETNAEQARSMRRAMQACYDAMALRYETPQYFTDRILHNYLYKGAGIYRSARRRLRRHDSFAAAIGRLPRSGRIAIYESGQGELPLAAAYSRPEADIEAVICDDDLRALASSCAGVPSNLHYAARTEGAYDATVRVEGDRIIVNRTWNDITT